MNDAQMVISIFIVGLILGSVIGTYFEHRFGYNAKEVKRYHNIVMRMIPKLKQHYTDDYILWELIRSDRRHDDKPLAKRTTNT